MKQSRTAVIAVIFALAIPLLAIGGCDLNGEVKEYSDPWTTIVVEEGEEFAIVLESNPTTGYQWKLAEPLEEEVVVLTGMEFEEAEEELLGAGGEERWTFKAEKRGETTISLAYVRPWEDEEPVVFEEGSEREEPSEEEAEEEGEAEETSGPEEPVEIGEPESEGPIMMVFDVKVVSEGSTEKTPKEYDNPDEEIEVEADLEFTIVLESNPTTGYQWQLAEPLDDSVLELVSVEFEEKSSEGEEIVGAPGEELWTFLALGEGDTEIELEYVRSWEGSPEEKRTFRVKVTSPEEAAEE